MLTTCGSSQVGQEGGGEQTQAVWGARGPPRRCRKDLWERGQSEYEGQGSGSLQLQQSGLPPRQPVGPALLWIAPTRAEFERGGEFAVLARAAGSRNPS